ncbi:MAG: helix-turn-helix domain-containing protein, partial [Acidimicrobiales bacterium]
MSQPWDEALDSLSVLVDPVRRSMYRFVRSAGRPANREEVAEATGTSMKLAAFHLDKLVDHGWLQAEYDRSSRPATGGRPPKLYTHT